MDQYGYLLARLAPGAALVRTRRELAPGRLNVLAPSAWLLRADPLPHSWDVTSDSIAAWFARALRARRLMLVKHVDGFIGPLRGPRAAPRTCGRSRSTRSPARWTPTSPGRWTPPPAAGSSAATCRTGSRA